MDTQAYFQNIREEIISRLDTAENSIKVAVAWFTDPELFEALIRCARRKVAVQVATLDDHINRNSSLALERLTVLGGQWHWIPEGDSRAGLLHHKFCLLDDRTVINGRYHWTRRTSDADENITIIDGNEDLFVGFAEAFAQLLSKHGIKDSAADIDSARLMKRLGVIRNLLELEDEESLSEQLDKLAYAGSLPQVAELILLIRSGNTSAALSHIDAMIARGMAIVVSEDPEVRHLRWQLLGLEAQVVALQAEYSDMERQLHEFDRRQDAALGEQIREYLLAKQRYFERSHRQTGRRDYQQAGDSTRRMREEYEEARAAQAEELPVAELSPEEQAELKQLYRKLAMQCHPDRVMAEEQDNARAVFQQLEAAYRNNDLAGLRQIQHHLKNGQAFAGAAQSLTELNRLQQSIVQMNARLSQLQQGIAALRATELWQILSQLEDWDTWFAQQATQLQADIDQYDAAAIEAQA